MSDEPNLCPICAEEFLADVVAELARRRKLNDPAAIDEINELHRVLTRLRNQVDQIR